MRTHLQPILWVDKNPLRDGTLLPNSLCGGAWQGAMGDENAYGLKSFSVA
jgi:hypothetical protein